MEPTKDMDEERMLGVCELLDDAKWDLDGVTNEGERILDDFELGQVYAALNIIISVADRFYERNLLDQDRIQRHLLERRDKK